MTQGYLLEVRIGVAEPASIALVPGTPLDPTSFGRSAMWRIGAEGVLDIHGYVYFDGRSLFVQSADETFPVLVNRHRVPMAWTEIRAPSTMFVGQAQVELKVSDMLARSGALVAMRPGDFAPPHAPPAYMPSRLAPFPEAEPALAAPEPPRGPWDGSTASPPPQQPLPAAGAPFARGAFVPQGDGESTRFAPLDPLGRTGANAAADPRAANTSPVIPVPLPLSAAAPAPKSGSLWARAKADWFATSLPKRILFLLSPLVVASYFSLLYGDEEDATDAARATPSASVSSASSPPSSESSPPQPPPIVGTAPTAIASADAPKANATTLERAAVNAYSEGNLPLALQLYDRLAREHPENPAFEKAARIVRDRLDAGR